MPDDRQINGRTLGEWAERARTLERERDNLRQQLERAENQLRIVEASNDRLAKTLEYGGDDWPPVEETTG